MIRAVAVLPLLALLAAAAPDATGTRRYTVSSFERIRVEGPFEVRLTTGTAPSAEAAADPDTLSALVVALDGTTLTVRRNGTDRNDARQGPPRVAVVTVGTPTLRSAIVTGGGRLSITGLKTPRADLSVNGAGTLAVTGAVTDQLNAIVIGTGTMALAGRAQRAQLLTNGSGAIDATGLDVNDLTVRVDGPGKTDASARFSATVTNSGLGQVTVAGNAACVVKAPAGGAVSCGKPN